MFETVFAILIGAYLVKIALFHLGIWRASARKRIAGEPTVSVIVAARNEESRIGQCLESLASLEYPRENIEVLVIDDQSTDGTRAVVEGWHDRIPGLKVLTASGTVDGLRGKANAVAQAILASRGEIILTTDADCVVPPNWVRDTVRQYDRDIGSVCGFTLLHARGWFSGMQSLDWTYMLAIASAGVGLGYPLSAVGNNMSYRRRAYDAVGGYSGVGFSVTEDFALLKAIAYRTSWKVRYPVDASTLVWSEPCADAGELYRQKQRWGRGGTAMHPAGMSVMAVGFLTSIALWILPWFGLPLGWWAMGLAAKSVCDMTLLARVLRTLGQLRLLRWFPVFELYYLVYVTALLFVVFLGGRVTWKDRRF